MHFIAAVFIVVKKLHLGVYICKVDSIWHGWVTCNTHESESNGARDMETRTQV